MSETVALLRLAIRRHWISMTVISAFVASGVVAATLFHWFGGANAQTLAITSMVITTVPAIVWTFALFLFGSEQDMLLAESGYHHWLLRLPIASWKLAIVPVLLKTLWVSALWWVIVLVSGMIGRDTPGLVGPAFAFSAASIWLMVLTWRPFSNGWWRLGALALCVIALYLTIVGTFVTVGDEHDKLSRWQARALGSLSYIMYATGVWMSVRALQLARTHARGIIAESERFSDRRHSSIDSGAVTPVDRRHGSPRTALIWHDLNKGSVLSRWVLILGVLPGATLLILLASFNVISYVMTIVLFTYAGFIIATSVLDRGEKGTIVLPPYLAASPISTVEIAWTRIAMIGAIVGGSLLMSLVVFAGWALWPSNRQAWAEWSTHMVEQTASPAAGIRVASAIFLITLLVLVGRSVAYVWQSLSGRSWLQFVVVALLSLGYLVPIGVGIGWFLQQESWEMVKANGLYWLGYLPILIVGWLLAKLFATMIALFVIHRTRLASRRATGLLLVGWGVAVLALAWVVHLLIPYPQATFAWCLAGMATALPLAGILAAPIALHYGRHQ